MTIVRTLWYLAALLAFALAMTSAVTIAPGNEGAIAIVMVILLSSAICCVVGAVLLYRLHRRKPDAPVFTSKVLLRVLVAATAFLTLFVLLGVLG